MTQHLVITAIGTDRPGMCNQIVHLVSNAECNIVDSRIAIYGSECTLSMLISGTANSVTRIESLLPLLGQDNDIITMTKRTTPPPKKDVSYSIEINVEAEDRVGLTEQLTQFFADRNIGLASLSTKIIDKAGIKLSHHQFLIAITAKHESDKSVAQLQQEFELLCDRLLVKGKINFIKKQPLKGSSSMNTLTAGSIAPDFSLHNQDDQAVTLSELKGKKVLLYFYPKAMTPGCTVQAQGLRDIKPQLDDLNVVVLGVSIDPVKRLGKFIDRDELNFTLLSDEDHAVADSYGVWGEKKFMGKVYDGLHRISFLIDEQGNIEHVFNKFKTKDHHQVVLDYLNQ